VTGTLDSNILALGLPPGVLARDTSPGSLRLISVAPVRNSMPHLGGRQSVQMGGTMDPRKVGETPLSVQSPLEDIQHGD
jgi:DEP domain-containing protein 5